MMTILHKLFLLMPAFLGLALIVWAAAKWEAKSRILNIAKQANDKEYIYPGQKINCRCYSESIINLDIDNYNTDTTKKLKDSKKDKTK